MSKMVILCVDDEAVILHSLKSELANLVDRKYTLEFAENGPEALEIFTDLIHEDWDIPVVISDYIMPGMKGDELLSRINRLAPQTLKIMLTGQAALEGIANAINHANLFHYLEKPWSKTELRSVVSEAIGSYYREKALAAENKNLTEARLQLEAKACEKALELEAIHAKLKTIAKMIPADQLPENILPFKEMGDVLSKIKTNLDSLGKLSATAGAGDMERLKTYLENENTLYEAHNEALEKIIVAVGKISLPAVPVRPAEEESHG